MSVSLRFIVVPILLIVSAAAATAPLKVQRAQESLGAADITQVSGFVGQRIRVNEQNRLKTFDIDRFVRMVEEKKHRDWWWIGEQPGKWLESAILAGRQSRDEALLKKADEVLRRLIAAQEPAGYLGITDPAVRTPQKPIRGMDPYELYFTFHGLITAHEQLNSQPALEAAKKLADYFLANFADGKCGFWAKPLPENKGHTLLAGHAVHASLEGTLLIDPILRLYIVTGEEKYLKWCQWCVNSIDAWSGQNSFTNLGKVAAGEMGIHQVQRYVHAHTFHMNFLGFLQLYQITGDPALLMMVQAACKDIVSRQMYITGGVSVGEHYEPGHNLPNTGHVVETCASMSWIELCQSLLELTADTAYADAIEKLLWNHLFAAQTVDGDGFAYHRPLTGEKPAAYWTGPDCCSASGARIIAKVPTLIYARAADGICINQFVPSAATVKLASGTQVIVKQSGDFPVGEKVIVEVAPAASESFTLRVRIPAWCQSPSLAVNDQPVSDAKPGTYAVITRAWKSGDRVVLTLPMKPTWIGGQHTNKDLWCLVRGPVAYALDSTWYDSATRNELSASAGAALPLRLGMVDPDAAKLKLIDPPAGAIGPAYEVPLTLITGQPGRGVLLPFANLGMWYRDEQEKKNPRAVSHPYAVWVAGKDHPGLKALQSDLARRTALAPRTVDRVVPSDERKHNPKGERSNTGPFQNRHYRHSGGGWFSWDLKVLPDVPMSLLVTYWGDDQPRSFDVLIDGTKIATQTLNHNKPGEFFDVEYDVPAELTQGKQKVTVRFQAHPNNTAGGVFECVILKAEPRKASAGGASVAMALTGVLQSADAPAPARVSLTVNPDKILNRVDEKIYGHFLEHIYHSCNGGLWGELIWDRSFEQSPNAGGWMVADGCIMQKSTATDVRLTFGDAKWTDYEYTLEAQKTGGAEGFLILFRVVGKQDYYWANLGGWQNKEHGLERGNKGANRRGVGKRIAGQIDSNKWYRIRVRCQGPRIQVFLDDQPVFDFTDSDKAHLRGAVGIGTWATQARYRNIKVTGLDGKTLFEGLPTNLSSASVAKFWQAYGEAKVQLLEDQPLNGERCQFIENAAGEAGLQQTPICVRPQETYRGSLWVRGEAAGGLVVRLLDGQTVLAEAALPQPTAEWKEYPFELKCSASVDNAILQVGVKGQAKVWIDQVSLMPESWRKEGGFRPDLLKAIAELRPPVIRWPGGCYASRYDWKGGIGPQHKRVKFPISMWDDVDVNSYGTDEFIAMCRKTNSEPLIVVNIGFHDKKENRGKYLQDACDWLEYCNSPATSKWGQVRATNGHPEPYNVKYWEIDNEVWALKADDYAQQVRSYAAALKKIDPSIKILACGSGQLGGHWADGDVAVIAKCADVIDYISLHHYEKPDLYANGPANAESFWRNRGEMIAKSKNPNLQIYVSEWNAQSTDWRTGLYAGGALNVFERYGERVGLAGPALFLRHVSANAWDNAFINFDHRTWFPAPNYVVMKLWRDHYAPHRIELTGDAGPLNAIATKSDDGKTIYLKLVNPSERACGVDLTLPGEMKAGSCSAEVVAPDSLEARNTLDNPSAIRATKLPVEVVGQSARVTLPRWSVAVIKISR